jgi:glucoamylase
MDLRKKLVTQSSVGVAALVFGALWFSACSWPSQPEPAAQGEMSYYAVGRKDCVGTARNDTSKVWYTIAGGALSDVYQPTVDITNMQSMQFIVSDGATFTDLQSRDMTYRVSTDSTGMVCTVKTTAKNGKYQLVSTYVADPGANTIVLQTEFKALEGSTSDLKLYVRVDPTINGNGGGGDPETGGNSGADSATIDADSGSEHKDRCGQRYVHQAHLSCGQGRQAFCAGGERIRRYKQ